MCGAVSTFGFAFYIQPVLMPMIAEMPRGKVGLKILSWSTRFVVLGEPVRAIHGQTRTFLLGKLHNLSRCQRNVKQSPKCLRNLTKTREAGSFWKFIIAFSRNKNSVFCEVGRSLKILGRGRKQPARSRFMVRKKVRPFEYDITSSTGCSTI